MKTRLVFFAGCVTILFIVGFAITKNQMAPPIEPRAGHAVEDTIRNLQFDAPSDAETAGVGQENSQNNVILKNEIKLNSWAGKNNNSPPSSSAPAPLTQTKCPDILAGMSKGRWVTRPLTQFEQMSMDVYLQTERSAFRIPPTFQRRDGKCGNNLTYEETPQYNHMWFKSICNPKGSTPCCKNDRCVNLPVEECRCPNCFDERQAIYPEFSTWQPDDQRCKPASFTKEEACRLLKGATIHVAGDSFVREVYIALAILLSGDDVAGALRGDLQTYERNQCIGLFQVTGAPCRNVIFEHGKVCEGTVEIKYTEMWNAKDLNRLRGIMKELHTRPKSFLILGQGIHDNFDTALMKHAFLKPLAEAHRGLQKPSTNCPSGELGRMNISISHSDPKGQRVTSHSDQKGQRVTSHSDPKGQGVTSHSDQKGQRVTSHSDPKGQGIVPVRIEAAEISNGKTEERNTSTENYKKFRFQSQHDFSPSFKSRMLLIDMNTPSLDKRNDNLNTTNHSNSQRGTPNPNMHETKRNGTLFNNKEKEKANTKESKATETYMSLKGDQSASRGKETLEQFLNQAGTILSENKTEKKSSYQEINEKQRYNISKNDLDTSHRTHNAINRTTEKDGDKTDEKALLQNISESKQSDMNKEKPISFSHRTTGSINSEINVSKPVTGCRSNETASLSHSPHLFWMGIHAPGLLKSPHFEAQSATGVRRFNRIIGEILDEEGIPRLETFDFTNGVLSFDGTHYGFAINMLKTNMFLTYVRETFTQDGKWR